MKRHVPLDYAVHHWHRCNDSCYSQKELDQSRAFPNHQEIRRLPAHYYCSDYRWQYEKGDILKNSGDSHTRGSHAAVQYYLDDYAA